MRLPQLTITLLALVPGPLLLADEPPTAGDLERLQGTWRAQVGPTEEVTITLSITGDRFERLVALSPRVSFTFEGRLRLDENAEPKRLDWISQRDPDGTSLPDAPALYQLNGDELTICSAAPGGEPPVSFEPGRGRYPALWTFHRISDPATPPPTGDLLAMQGTWIGPAGPRGALTATLVIDGQNAHFVIVGPDGQEALASGGLVSLDETAEPKTMDWTPEAGGSPPMLSIYEFTEDGQSLRLGLGFGAARGPVPRPRRFSADFRTITLRKENEDAPTETEQGRGNGSPGQSRSGR